MAALKMNWQLKGTSVRKPVGLLNSVNSCYIISVLQCLTYTPPLANYCIERKHSLNCKGNSLCLMCLLEKRIERSLTEPNCSPTDLPGDITDNLRLVGKYFSNERQEDAQEFYINLIDACERVDNFVDQIFKGLFVSHRKCSFCGYKSDTEEAYIDISVSIEASTSLEEALSRMFQTEDKVRCSGCHHPSSLATQLQILNPSNVLAIHLKRFQMNNDNGTNKITRYIEFQECIELSNYMDSSSSSTIKFQLYAIIVHLGESSNNGHYVAYVKNANDVWYKCDDGHVTEVSLESVLMESAYILFYVRKIHSIGWNWHACTIS